MNSIYCRVCGCELFAAPLFVLNNVPKAAQFLPRQEEFRHDKAVDLRVCQCSGCGLVQLDNQPVEYYKEVITAARWSEKMISFRSGQMKAFVDRFSLTGSRIVEVGCGEGYLLDILEAAGVSAFGVEASPGSVLTARQAGRKVSEGYVDNGYQIDTQLFDGFISINFLEHAPNPNGLLRGIYHNLTEKAVGLVEVPNFEKDLLHKRYYNFIADHLSYFTKDTLRFFLEKNGFAVLECYTTWEDDDIVAIVRKKEPLDLAARFSGMYKLKDDLCNIVSAYKKKGGKVAVWGASHQALTLLALCGLSDIAYVIDSAVFKQGKYTPILHLPIVPPETLTHNPADLVIVMAAGYSDEVVKILASMNPTLAVAVLRENGLEFTGK